MMKKEKLEQMRELGRGGLSKGLTMLRNAAEKAAAAAEAANEKNAQHAALEDGSAIDAPSAATGTASGNGSSRLTYDELVTLSMKLTRQNKMMKAQFQKIQVRINALSVKEANERVLTDFVKHVVGVDLDACHVDESKSSTSSGSETAGDAASTTEQPSAAVKATIDASELKQRYEIQHELNEREHRRIEERLRAELAALQSRTASNGSSSSSNDAAAPGDAESVSLLSFSPVGAPPAPELRNYDEIDLLNEPFAAASAPAPAFPAFDAFASSTSESSADTVVRLEKQLADAHAALEQLRIDAERSAREHDEQTTASTNALTQRGERVLELETALGDLQRTLADRESAEQTWQARWDEQTQTLAGLRAELALKSNAATSLAAENATVTAQLKELQTAHAAAAASPATSADSDAVAQLSADVARLNETIASLMEASAATQASLDQTQSDHDALMSAHSALKTELDAKRSEIETLQREVASLEAAAASATSASDATKGDGEELARLQDAVASLTKTLADKDAQFAALESALASTRVECDKLRDAAAAVNADPTNDSEQRTDDERDARDAELAQLRDAAATLTHENAALKAKLSAASEEASATASAGGGADDVAALLDELERVKMARAEVDHALRIAQDKLRAVEAQLKAAQDETEASKALVDALKADTSRLVDELAASERTRTQVQTELDALASAKSAVDEELSVLRHDTTANLEQTLSEVEALKAQVATAEREQALAESRMAEERAYLTTKLESLIKEHAALDATLADKDKQVAKMAASQASMTSEMMELQTQLAAMREDLHMAAEGLEAHATRAEQSDLMRQEVEGKMANLTLQIDALRDQHVTDFEMLRQEKERELERVKLERHGLAQQLRALETTRFELETSVAALESALRDEQARVAELEAIASQQTTEIGNLSVDLAETKKALSDRMGLATRLQTENMGIAAKQAEQAALIENALKDAAASRAKTEAMAAELHDANAAMTRATQLKDETVAAMRAMERDVAAQTLALEDAQARMAAQCRADVDAERAACKREIERIEAESKHKSKLALQAVLEKEAEIARLSTRLAELEEDVRSGDADHRKIFEVAQLQAKREAESRAQALQLQDMDAQLEDAQQQIRRLQDEKLAHESELTALMQTQRREGVNMEYLKNVVVQYMSFRPGSSQQARLVPVLSTLLQFSAHDMKEIKNASSTRRSSWTSWGTETKDYKPILDAKTPTPHHSMPPPSPGIAAGASARASSFTLPHAMASASSDPSAFASHATSESHDF